MTSSIAHHFFTNVTRMGWLVKWLVEMVGATEWWAKQFILPVYLYWVQLLLQMSEKAAKSLDNVTTSCVAIYSHVQLYQQSAEPVTDNQGTCGCLTQLVNQKQHEQFLSMIHTYGTAPKVTLHSCTTLCSRLENLILYTLLLIYTTRVWVE